MWPVVTQLLNGRERKYPLGCLTLKPLLRLAQNNSLLDHLMPIRYVVAMEICRSATAEGLRSQGLSVPPSSTSSLTSTGSLGFLLRGLPRVPWRVSMIDLWVSPLLLVPYHFSPKMARTYLRRSEEIGQTKRRNEGTEQRRNKDKMRAHVFVPEGSMSMR